MNKYIQSEDSNRNSMLVLKGDIDQNVEQAILSTNWEKLVLFGVEWPDYTPLEKYKDKIKWLGVPLGPDSSNGLEKLSCLERLEITDRIKPDVDFRVFSNLKKLKTMSPAKSKISFLNNENLISLHLDGFTQKDLCCLNELHNLEILSINKGSLESLEGMQAMKSLEALVLSKQTKLHDISSVSELKNIQTLKIDGAPKLKELSRLPASKSLKAIEIYINKMSMDNTHSLKDLPSLELFKSDIVFAELNWNDLAQLPLKKLSISAIESNLGDDEIKSFFKKNNKTISHFEKFSGKVPTYFIEFE